MTNESADRSKADKPKRKAPRTAWKPGQSGNPKGGPKRGMSWAELIVKVGNEPMPGKAGITRKEWVVRRAYALACRGHGAILRELWQRSEPQGAELTIHHDWREEARAQGLSESAVLAEVENILRENETNGDEPDHRAGD